MSGLEINRKRDSHTVRWTVILISLIAVVAYAYFCARWYTTGELSPLPMPVAAAGNAVDTSAISEAHLSMHKVEADEPRYIAIPALHIGKSRIMKLGVNVSHTLDMPVNINDTGWYGKSAKPGSGTGAVLLDAYQQAPASQGVFTALSDIARGDEITIERGDGQRFIYEVADVRSKTTEWVNQQGMKEMMYSADTGTEGLNIVACSGRWVPKNQTCDHRLLIRAVLSE